MVLPADMQLGCTRLRCDQPFWVLAGSCETVNTLCGFFEDHAKGVEIDLETLYDASTCEVTFE